MEFGQMPSHFANFTARRRRAACDVAPFERPALSSAVVDAVLRFHDEEQDQGSGRTLLRLSKKRLRDAEVAAALGDQKKRAAGVAILWNERESEIIRVLEAA
jgi:GDP-D-mannose dehydratase